MTTPSSFEHTFASVVVECDIQEWGDVWEGNAPTVILRSYIDDFEQAIYPLRQAVSADKLADDVRRWAETFSVLKFKGPPEGHFFYEVSVPVGNGSVKFGFSCSRPAVTNIDRATAYEYVEAVVHRQLLVWLNSDAAKTIGLGSQIVASNHPTNNTPSGATFAVSALAISAGDNGQKYAKLKGGRFSKHGVRVWPEVLETIGLDLDELQPGTYPPKQNYTAVVEEYEHEGKNRKRVAEIIINE